MAISVGTVVDSTIWLTGVTNSTTTFTDTADAPFTSSALTTSFPNLTSVGSGVAGANLITTISSRTNTTTVVLATAASTSHTSAFAFGVGTLDTNGTTTLIGTCTDAVTAGDVLVVCVDFETTNSVVSISDTSGNTYVLATTGTASGFLAESIYVAANCAAASAGTNKVTVTLTNAFTSLGNQIRIVPIHGADTEAPVVTSNTNSGTGTALTSSTYSTIYHDTITIAFTSVSNAITSGQSTYTVGTIDPFSNIYEYKIFSTAQTSITTTATQSAGGTPHWIISTVVLRTAQAKLFVSAPRTQEPVLASPVTQSLISGLGSGILGSAISLGFGAPAQPPSSAISNVTEELFNLYASGSRPPNVFATSGRAEILGNVSRGFGNAAQPPTIINGVLMAAMFGAAPNDPYAPTLLPPNQFIGSGSSDVFDNFSKGAGNPAVAPFSNVGMPPSTADLPAITALLAGGNQGTPPQAPVVVSIAPVLAPELPPTQARYAGFGVPAQAPFFVSIVPPASADLPPKQAIAKGAGSQAQPASQVNSSPALFIDLPPKQSSIVGAGNPAQQPNVIHNGDNSPLVTSAGYAPSIPDLPPFGFESAPGAGTAAQSWYISRAIPPIATFDLPPAQTMLKGAGDPAAATKTFYALPISDIRPPPSFQIIPGFGAAAQSITFRPISVGPSDPASLPPIQMSVAGFGTAAQPPNILVNGDNAPLVTSAAYAPVVADQPPSQYVIKGTGNAAQPPNIINNGDNATLVASASFAFATELPPKQYVLVGGGKPAQPAFLTVGGPPPIAIVPELPPQTYILKGFGLPAQPPSIVTNDNSGTLVSSAAFAPLLPDIFKQLIVSGAGAPAQSVSLSIQSLPAPSADRPPQQSIVAGFGSPPSPAVTTYAIPAPSAELPPRNLVNAGAGVPAQPPATYYGLAQPYALAPPSQAIAAGFGTSAQPPATFYGVTTTIGGVHVAALLPPTQVRTSGAGIPASPPVQLFGIAQPYALLPPQDSAISGSGNPAVTGAAVYGLPAPAALLPPSPSSIQGFGNPAVVGTIAYGKPPPDVPAVPSPQSIFTGFGLPPGKRFLVTVVPPFAVPDLPPLQSLAAGFGQPAQAWATFEGLPPQTADLPATQTIFKGVGRPGQPPVTYYGLPASFADRPPIDALYAGFGAPARGPAIYSGLPAPYVVLPPQDLVAAGKGNPAQQPNILVNGDNAPLVVSAAYAPVAIFDLPATTAIAAGGVQPPTAHTFVGLPPFAVPELPPNQSRFAGKGIPAQVGVITYGLPAGVAPYPILPPSQYMLAGFGKPAQPSFLLPFVSVPQLVPDLAPPQFMFAGAGQAAQTAAVILSVPPPELAPLPPTQGIFYRLIYLDTLKFIQLPPTRSLVAVLSPSKAAS